MYFLTKFRLRRFVNVVYRGASGERDPALTDLFILAVAITTVV